MDPKEEGVDGVNWRTSGKLSKGEDWSLEDKEPDGTREFEISMEPSSKGEGEEEGKTNCDLGVVGNIRSLSSSSLKEGEVEGGGELVGTGVGINL